MRCACLQRQQPQVQLPLPPRPGTSSSASPARPRPGETRTMRKMLVIALREYHAAVRTRSFVVGLLIMPILMGGSLVVQRLLRDFRDTREKKFAVLDRTPKGQALRAVEACVAAYNANRPVDEK